MPSTRKTALAWGATAALLINCATMVRSSSAQPSEPSTDVAGHEDYWAKKIVLLEVDESSAVENDTSSVWLIDVKLVEIGGRFFLVGVTYVPENVGYKAYETMRDVTQGIAWDDVKAFRAFTKDQFETYLKHFDDDAEE
jgi:hypothetical protein